MIFEINNLVVYELVSFHVWWTPTASIVKVGGGHLNWTRRKNNVWQWIRLANKQLLTILLPRNFDDNRCGWEVKKSFFEPTKSITANVNFNNFVPGVLGYDVFIFFTVFFHTIAVVRKQICANTREHVSMTWNPDRVCCIVRLIITLRY